MSFTKIKLSDYLDKHVFKKPKLIPFADLTVGHVYEVEDYVELKEGVFWCAFCGGRGKKYVLLKRDDGLHIKVGTRCLCRVGLEIPKTIKGKKKEEGKNSDKKVGLKQSVDATIVDLDAEIERLLKGL